MDVTYGMTAIAVLFLALLYARRLARAQKARTRGAARRRTAAAHRGSLSARSDMRAGESTITLIESLQQKRAASTRD